MARHLDPGARVRHACLAVALVAATMAAVSATPVGASAVSGDKLVVVDVAGAGSDSLSGVSLRTLFTTDNAGNNVASVGLPTADGGGQKAITLSGGSDGNGALSLSDDKNYISLAGFNRAPGPVSFTHTVKGTAGNPAPVTETITKPKDTYASEIRRGFAKVSSTGGTPNISTVGFSDNTLSSSAPRQAFGISGDIYLTGNGNGETADSTYNSGTGVWTSQPKNTTDGGVIKVASDGSAKVNISCPGTTAPCSVKQSNARQLALVGNQGAPKLYMDSEKGGVRGIGDWATGLPTSVGNVSQRVTITTDTANDVPVPIAMNLLNVDGTTGADVAYVYIEKYLSIVNPEIRKYKSTDQGATWTAAGAKSGTYPFFTTRFNSADNKVEFFATKGSAGGSVVSFQDTAPTGSGDFSAETTIATAKTDHAFRGIAFAPTDWDPGTVSTAITTEDDTVGGTLGDSDNPTGKLTVSDTDTDLADLSVSATSSKPSVIPDSGITITGAGETRTASFEPTGVGRADITFTVDDQDGHTATTTVKYAASAAPTSASGRYFYQSSDLSSAIDVGDGYVLAESSEDNALRLYRHGKTGRPVKTFDFSGSSGIGSTNADLESMARVNDTLYVLGSHGNNSSGDAKPARRVLFTAAIGGSGADTTLTYLGKDTTLWDKLRTWDQANNNRLGFAAGQAPGVPANDSNGFNIEGFELAPGSATSGYLGFRAPLVSYEGKPSAVIVPVKNLSPLMTGTLSFDDPIYLDLGGRTIREVRKNGQDEYLISASTFSAGNPQWALFAWNGKPDGKPILVADLPSPDPHRTGSWESIVSVPNPLAAGGTVSLITDSGDTTFYGDVISGTEESKGLRKSYVDEFTVNSFTAYPDSPANVTATPGPGSIDVGWDEVTGATSYLVKVKTGTTVTSKSVDAPATSTTISGLSSASTYSTSVSAVNGSGTSDPTAGPDVTPQAPPFAPPSNLSSPSHTASSVALAWAKVSGASGYVLSKRIGSGPANTIQVGDVSSASFTNLSASTEYTFDIRAVKADGTQSPASEPLNVTTSAAPADRPTDVHWTSRTSSAVTIAWTKKSGSAKYKIRYFPEGTKTYTYLTVGNVSSAEVKGLSRGKSYVFKVAAISSSGTVSPYSTPNLIASTSNLLKPTNFVKTSRTATTITLTWTRAAGAEGYRVAYGIGTGARTYVDVGGGDTETVTITGLTAGKQYTLAIASTELSGTSRSSYTPRISVTTAAS